MIDNINALKKIKQLDDNSIDIIFADPPYALGSEVYIDKEDGKPKYKIAKDFMNRWDMPNHEFWEEFFQEVNRVLKYGGRCLLFGMDRQLMLFQYYATMGGLLTNQSLYWVVASNFPKAMDLSKAIDKRLGINRKIIGTKNDFSLDGANRVSKSNSDLGQKYEGYKYSISPLKQTVETIMVFQKSIKNKTMLDDVLAFENGDNSISPSIWYIDGGRILTDENIGRFQKDGPLPSNLGFNSNSMGNKFQEGSELGRYPSQLFIDLEMAKNFDKQSGILKSGAIKKSYIRRGKNPNGTYGKFNEYNMTDTEKSEGGLSRFFHQIPYLTDEVDLMLYCSKVSSKERNYGLEDSEDIERKDGENNQGTRICTNCGLTDNGTNNHSACSGIFEYKLCKPLKNNHPTLKPIKLIYNIAKLLKTPNEQKVFFPFAGSGSEIIGFIKAGFNKNNFEASELSQDYIDIAMKRVEFWEKISVENILNKKYK